MSLPITDLEFDDEMGRSWSRFRTALVARVETLTPTQVLTFVGERPDTHGPASDLTFRSLHHGVLCAVMTVEDAPDSPAPPTDWARTGAHHLTGITSGAAVGELVGAAIDLARNAWGITHPSFLRPIASPRTAPPGSRSAAMADHPAGGVGRAVRRIVEQQLAGVVEVDHHQSIELRYPDALVHLQVWEVERSALLWTTIDGVVDPSRLNLAQQIVDSWPGIELLVDGSIVDVELAVELGDRPSRSMIAAIDSWHAFMETAYAAIVDALVHPGDESNCEVSVPLQTVLLRHRNGRRVTPDDIDELLRLGRTTLIESLDVCRRRSVSWMSWAERRRHVGDIDGSATACTEAQMWDAAFATVSRTLRQTVSPTT